LGSKKQNKGEIIKERQKQKGKKKRENLLFPPFGEHTLSIIKFNNLLRKLMEV